MGPSFKNDARLKVAVLRLPVSLGDKRITRSEWGSGCASAVSDVGARAGVVLQDDDDGEETEE